MKKVIVAMSGGVDSSVAAALLKKEGYDVQGVYLRLFKDVSSDKNEEVAKEVAKILNIDFKVFDARKEFKNKIIGHFLDGYEKGRTPNPCIICNPGIKFKIILEYAAEMKADYAATGHYAKIAKREARNVKRYVLMEARDKNKDQSYFLYRLKQKQLAKIIFPLGNYLKTEVRKMAKKFNLPVYEKKESQDVCFLAGSTVKDFLSQNIRMKSGEIADDAGNVIGCHTGLALYTIGQRKGISIGANGPYYVTGKNKPKNRLLVTNNPKNPALFSATAEIEKVNWLAGPPKAKRLLARTRYRNPLVYATIAKYKAKYKLTFDKPQRAVASGQSIVFYAKNGEVLGGGIINF